MISAQDVKISVATTEDELFRNSRTRKRRQLGQLVLLGQFKQFFKKLPLTWIHLVASA